ncbi:MAG: Hint domain-containing protein [Paracoccaceae bacterium]
MSTKVLTRDGEIPVEFLEVGEPVVTRQGARVLRLVEVSLIAHARMVRIGGVTLGRAGPGTDVLVPATQKVLVRDWRARAFGGGRQALVAAARLADGEFIRGEILDPVRLFTLGFDCDVVIQAGGLELECAAAPT